MRKLLTLIFLLFSAINFAQLPQGFNYQAVVRNSNGDLMQNQDLTVKVSLLQGSSSSSSIYTEIKSTQTNEYGLINLVIGQGESSDNFTTVDWSNLPYYLKIEIDLGDGAGYKEIGISQLLSVPFAMYAGNTENTDDADADPTNELQLLSISNDTIYLSQGNFVKLPEASIPQQFSVSEFGDTLYLSNGNSIVIPGISINNYDYKKYGAFFEDYNGYYDGITKTNDDNLVIFDGAYSFTKIDTLGQEIWSKSYPIDTLLGPDNKSLYQTNDGGAIAIWNGNAPYTFDLSVLIKINSSGDTLWTKIMDFKLNNIYENSENKYLVGTSKYNMESPGSYSMLVKLDETGDTIWTKTYEYDDLGVVGVSNIYETSIGNYLFVNHKLMENTIYKVDSQGDTIWTYSGSISGNPISCISETIDNKYLIVSYGAKESYVTKLDTDKSIVWSKEFTGSEYGGNLYNAFNLSNGDILLVGESGGGEFETPLNGHGQEDIWVLRLNSNGEIIASDLYGGSYSESYKNSYLLNNGKLLILSVTGSSDGNVPENESNPDNQGLWIFNLSIE